MKVFILAAGIGSRLSRASQDRPKCLLPLGGRPMICWMLDRFERHGLNDVTLITGYKRETIVAELGDRVRYRHNPFFRVTNSIASLWFARDLLTGPALIVNGDLFFEDRLLDLVLGDTRSPVLFADTSRTVGADYRFRLEADRIVGYGKDIPDAETHAEYVGIGRVAAADMPAFRTRLEKLVEGEHHDKWWEDVLYSWIPEKRSVFASDVKGVFWAEADFVQDYERILKWISEHPHSS
jgi:choline kinase